MSLLGFWGFDSCAVQKYPEWSDVLSSTGVGRDGIANHATGIAGNNYGQLNIPGGATGGIILGYAFNPGSSALNLLPRLPEFRIGTTVCAYIGATGDGHIGLFSPTGTLWVQSANLFPGAIWGYLEIRYAPHASAGSLTVRWNEIDVINYTGQTSSASPQIDNLNFRNSNSGSLYDDMYLMDFVDETATAGRANNTFLGDVRVAHSTPTADGSTVTLTPSAAGAHAALVDETPPNTTDYVSALGGGGSSAKDLYAMADLPAASVLILGLRVGLYAAKTDAGVSAVKTLIRESGGTETAGPSQPLSVTYTGYFSPYYKVRPSNGAAFTPADVNNLEAGCQVA